MFIIDESSSERLHREIRCSTELWRDFPRRFPRLSHISCPENTRQKSSKKSLTVTVERQHDAHRIHWMQTVTDQCVLRTFVPQTVVKIGTNVALAPTWLETPRPHFPISTD